MKFFYLLLLSPIFSLAQTPLDKKITVNYVDTAGLYERVRLRFIKENYVIKEDHNPDTITTYAKIKRPLGYMYMIAAIKGNTVTFWGFWSERAANMTGPALSLSKFKPVVYFQRNAGIGWRELRKFAGTLGRDYDYSP